jgi:DNA-binding response OmpR family regulator
MPNTKAKKIKVLLIEDYPGHVEIVKRMLGKIKKPLFNLEYTDRLSTGLERFTKGKIDVIILDLTLPDSKGLDTFLRLHDRALHTPIIVTSALDDEVLAVKAVQAGAQDYLVKGQFDINLLKRSILYSIERKRLENFIQIQRNLGIALSGIRNLKNALALVVDAATTIEDMDCGGIYLVDPISETIDLKYSKGLSPNFVKHVSHYNKDSARLHLVMKGIPVFLEYSELKIPQYKVEHLEGLKAIAIIPILYQGRVIACMNIASHTQKNISSSAQHVLEIIASQASIAIARLMVEETLRESEERYRSHL